MYQLHWAIECLDIWPDIILSISVQSTEYFCGEINIYIGKVSKADCPLYCR